MRSLAVDSERTEIGTADIIKNSFFYSLSGFLYNESPRFLCKSSKRPGLNEKRPNR